MFSRYDFEDKEVSYLLKAGDELDHKFSDGVLEDIIPGLKYVYKTQAMKETEEFAKVLLEDFMRRKFKEVESSFDKGIYKSKSHLGSHLCTQCIKMY